MSEHTNELLQQSASQLANLYRLREVSPVDVTRAVLERSAQRQADLNAFAALDEKGALAAARAAEQRFRDGAPLGPLDGVPIAVKDLVDVAGFVTRRGSLTTVQHAPVPQDAPSIAPLRRQGAVLFGKTTTHEFGLGSQHIPHTGITRNPWSLAHRPGGSSAGAVAAVAAGLGPLGVGTDGGGSIREPAAYTGLVGFKPSYGWVPAQLPTVAGVPPLVGPITHGVVDAITLFRALAGRDARDPFSLPATFRTPLEGPLRDWRTVRVAVAAKVNGIEPTPGVAATFDAAIAVFIRLGAQVENVSTPRAPDTLRRLSLARAAWTLRGLDPARRALVDPSVLLAAHEGEQLSALDLVEAEADRADHAAQWAALFEQHDLLITPTVAHVAPPVDSETPNRRVSAAAPFSWTRQPAISVPAGLAPASDGSVSLPVGLQIVGRHYEDEFVLAAALAYELHATHLDELRRRAVALRT
jgi:aspartyl-tRNA(Asn)/glutamyl-tRNA(Gln) amidotransferase subunit A